MIQAVMLPPQPVQGLVVTGIARFLGGSPDLAHLRLNQALLGRNGRM